MGGGGGGILQGAQPRAPLVIRVLYSLRERLLRARMQGEARPVKTTVGVGARWGGVAAAGLLWVYAAMAFSASFSKGVSFDEGQQLAVGYNLWLHDDYRIEGANGDFIKRWATLPYLVSRPNFPGRDDANWRRAEPYEVGFKFFFEAGNRPEELLRQGARDGGAVGRGDGWLVFRWALVGVVWHGGRIDFAGAVCVQPAHAGVWAIVSTEMSITLSMLAATGCIWRLVHTVTAGRVAASLAVVGLLVLAKLSGS